MKAFRDVRILPVVLVAVFGLIIGAAAVAGIGYVIYLGLERGAKTVGLR